jgi:tetratricopeptide (TPR) repeat protein
MLFDLRSRGRRRTVQVLYIGLAILIGCGLILFGVGTGTGGGGLFGALTGNNSSSGGNSAVTNATKKAVARTKAHPSSAAAWAALVNARFSAANSLGYNSNTNAYTAAGTQQLKLATQAYTRYLKLTKTPSATTATIAAHSYTQLKDFSSAADTYQTVLRAQPGQIKALECVALTSYAAGNDQVAQLAQARVLAKLPKSVRASDKTELESAKKSKTVVLETC